MNVDEAIDTLRYHAGFSAASRVPQSLVTSLNVSGSEQGEGLDKALREVVAAIDVVNRMMNGPIPSENISGRGLEVPRVVASAISGILEDLSRATLKSTEPYMLHIVTWRIASAWNAVLAGDIDDVLEHVRLEEMTLNLRGQR